MLDVRYFFLILLALIVASTEAAAQLPKELRDVAAAAGCKQIENFFERSGDVYPAYIYEYPPRSLREIGETRAAFVCRSSPSVNEYWIVFVEGKRIHHPHCNPIVKMSFLEPLVVPNGLSASSTKKDPLSSYYVLASPGKKVATKGFTEYAPLLVDWNGGSGEALYCHRGTWLIKPYH